MLLLSPQSRLCGVPVKRWYPSRWSGSCALPRAIRCWQAAPAMQPSIRRVSADTPAGRTPASFPAGSSSRRWLPAKTCHRQLFCRGTWKQPCSFIVQRYSQEGDDCYRNLPYVVKSSQQGGQAAPPLLLLPILAAVACIMITMVSSMIIPGNRDLFFRKSFSHQRLHQNGKIGSSSGMPWNEPRKPKTAGLPENLLSHFPLNCQGRHKSHYSVISSKIILSIWECVLTLRSTTQTVIIPTPISC